MTEDKQAYWRSLSVQSKAKRKRKATGADAEVALYRKIVDANTEKERVQCECREVWE